MTALAPQTDRPRRRQTVVRSHWRPATPEQRAQWQQWVDVELEAWPELRTVKPLEPLPFAVGAWSFDAKAEFQRHVESFRIRDPLQGDAVGIPVHRAMGSCLYPLGREGDLIYSDPHATPQHGDMVDLLLHPDYWAMLNADAYGRRPSPFVGKIVHVTGCVRWALFSAGAFELDDHQCLGVVRRIVRDGQRVYE